MRSLKRLFFFFIFFGILFFANATSVLLRPYKIFVYKTERFDILFPEKCRETAEILVENADFLYEKAKKTLESDVDMRMPVIISPDSDEFSAQYTPQPYNRIIIFEAFPGFNVRDEKQIILSAFYNEIFTAILQSERGGFNNFVGKIFGSSYQPVVQLNMPFSFVEGFSLLADDLDDIRNADYFVNRDNDDSDFNFNAENFSDENSDKNPAGENFSDNLENLAIDENSRAGLENFAKNPAEDENFRNDLKNSPAGVTSVFAKNSDRNPDSAVEISSSEFSSADLKKIPGKILSADFSDSDFLRILIQAKAENKFPNHFQARIKNDVYPYDKIILAATSGFSAYLMQRYGFEKYVELWKESGKLNFLLTNGVFYNVYKKNLQTLWNEFYDAIPEPFDKAKIDELEKKTKTLLPNNSQGLYRNVIFSDYGIIWYDSLKHEVDIFKNFSDFENPSSIRNLLFLANDIENLSLSPDGRFLAVSFTQIKNRQNLKKKACWIFDLQERKFLSQKFNLENAAFFSSSEKNVFFNKNDSKSSSYLTAGINIEDKIPKLQIYSFSDENSEPFLIFEKKFALDEIPVSVTFTPNGEACVLISKNDNQLIAFINPANFEEKIFSLEWKNQDGESKRFKIQNLRTAKISSPKLTNEYRDFLYAFDFSLQSEFSFERAGCLTLTENFEPNDVFFMTDDLPGGVNFACFKDDSIFYSSQKILNDELKSVEKKYIEFERGSVKKVENFSFASDSDFQEKIATANEIVNENKNLAQNLPILNDGTENYSPLKYFFPFSVRPFLPIRSFSTDNGAELWPGLGITFISQTDPFENTEFMISFGYAYAKLDFESGFNISDYYAKYKEKYELLSRKDKSVALFLRNSSTPVDISFGNIFRFNFDGEYFFEGVIGTSWQIPLGMNFSNMKIKIESDFTASTDYYDSNLIYQNESLKNWPKFSDSYELFEAAVETEYSNVHQYGLSPYEKRGFSVGLRLYSIWDLTQIRILNKYKEEQSEQIKINGEDYYLTEAQLKESYDERMRAISQINLGVLAKIEIPRLTPLKMINGWVLSVPASVDAALFNETGTALKVKTEILLLGKEIHDGFSFLQLYFGRIGLKSGYELNLKYDTAKVLKPDIRRKNYIGEILSDAFLDENFYFLLNIDFTTSIGFSTAMTFSIENKFAFFPRSNGFLYSVNFVARF